MPPETVCMEMNIMNTHETLVLGGGCFWCTEAVYKEVRGVLDVESGYSNGQARAPSYEEVCTGTTGCHPAPDSAESARVRRDGCARWSFARGCHF